MASKKKNKKKVNTNSGKLLSYSLIIGLSTGVVLGAILLIAFDNLFYFGLAPILCLTVGLFVGSMLEKNSTSTIKPKVQKAKN